MKYTRKLGALIQRHKGPIGEKDNLPFVALRQGAGAAGFSALARPPGPNRHRWPGSAKPRR